MPEPKGTPAAPVLFDRDRVARRYAARPHKEIDFVTGVVRSDLNERLASLTQRFVAAIVIGPDASLLPTSGKTEAGPIAFARLATLAGTAGTVALGAGPPALPLRDYDLIVSLLDLQIVNDLPAYLVGLRHHLRPGGLFLGAAPGGNTLTELRQAWLSAESELRPGAVPRVAPMLDLRDAGMLLQRAGFDMPVTDVETHLVRYPDPMALMRELKTMGASNPLMERGPSPVTRNLLAAAARRYIEIASDPDGRVRATLEVVWLSGRAPQNGLPM